MLNRWRTPCWRLTTPFASSVGVPPLVWSERLAAFAQEWADYLATHRQFFHRRDSPYGENLFEITGAQRLARGGGERLGLGIQKLSIPFELLPRGVRPLYANRLARHQAGRMRSRPQRAHRSMGLQLRSAGQFHRQAALLRRPHLHHLQSLRFGAFPGDCEIARDRVFSDFIRMRLAGFACGQQFDLGCGVIEL